MEAKRNRFWGRERLLRELVQGVLGPRPASFSLVGAKFLGKSQILRYLASESGPLLNPSMEAWRPPRYSSGKRVIVLKINCNWREVQQDLLGYIYERLAEQIRKEEAITLDWDEIERYLTADGRLLSIARQVNTMAYRIILLFDSFDSVFAAQLLTRDVVDALHPLALEVAIIVATEQPLHDLDRELAASPLFNIKTQLFIKLVEPEAARDWIDAYGDTYPIVSQIGVDLLEITGAHPYLLSRVGDVLKEVQRMLPPESVIGAKHFPLIRLRLAEHGRLLFAKQWHKLQNPPPRTQTEAVLPLVAQLLRGPLSIAQLKRTECSIINWLINQAIVTVGRHGYQLFSPLLGEFIAGRLPQAITETRTSLDISSVPEAPIYQKLTKIETALLRYFEACSNRVVSPEQLLSDVWKRPNASPRRVQEAIRRLRKQLEEAEEPVGVIENDRGRGYRFVPANAINNSGSANRP